MALQRPLWYRLARALRVLPVREGAAERALSAPPREVYAALTADPTPAQEKAWGIHAYERVSPTEARYHQWGRPVTAHLERQDPPRRLTTRLESGDQEEAHHWRLEAEGEGTRLRVVIRLNFPVPGGRMARRLERVLDDVAERVAHREDEEAGEVAEEADL